MKHRKTPGRHRVRRRPSAVRRLSSALAAVVTR